MFSRLMEILTYVTATMPEADAKRICKLALARYADVCPKECRYRWEDVVEAYLALTTAGLPEAEVNRKRLMYSHFCPKSDLHESGWVSEGGLVDLVATPVSLLAPHLLHTASFSESCLYFYPFIVYCFSLMFLLLRSAVAERNLRTHLGGVAWHIPIFFLTSRWVALRNNFSFKSYSFFNYVLPLRLNIFTARVFRQQRVLLLSFGGLLVYSWFFIPLLALCLFDFLNWSYVQPSVFSPIVFVLYYTYLFMHGRGFFSQTLQCGFSSFFNHFFINDFVILLVLIFLFLTLYMLYALEKTVLLELVGTFEYAILLGYNILSLALLLCCSNFFTLLILIELFSYSAYILIALRKVVTFGLVQQGAKHLYQNNPLATEAGMKYFLYGALNSLCFVIALIILLIPNYDLTYSNVANLVYLASFNAPASILGFRLMLFFFLMGFIFELAAFPLHWWLVDVFTASSLLLVSYIGLPAKVIFTFVFLFIFYGVFNTWDEWGVLAVLFSLLGMIWGAVGMLRQRQIKRFFAYSTVNHIGYILYGLAFPALFSSLERAASITVAPSLAEGVLPFLPNQYYIFWDFDQNLYNTALFKEALTGALVYLLGYVVMMLMVFTMLAWFQSSTQSIGYLGQLVHFEFLFLPRVRVIFFLLLMSLIGIPPLLGFWGKYYLFYVAVKAALFPVSSLSAALLWFSPLAIILSSILSAYGYLIMVKNMYVTENYVKNEKIIPSNDIF